MFTKSVRAFLALTIIVIAVLSPSGIVSAKGPDCQVNASETNPKIGEEVSFSVSTSLTGLVSWDFADGVRSLDQDPKHTYNGIGVYVVMAEIRVDRYNTTWCTTTIVVKNGTVAATPATTPTMPAPTAVVTPPQGFGTTSSAGGTIQGDNNIAPVVNGDGNRFVIKIEQPVTQPVTITSKPIVTQKTNIITAFIHAILKAMEQFIHTLDESWFKPTLVQ